MDKNKDFSALRLRRENISYFQDLKMAYESGNFTHISNDAFFELLMNAALSADGQLARQYSNLQRHRASTDTPALRVNDAIGNDIKDELPHEIQDIDNQY